jgi:hypothetical protein
MDTGTVVSTVTEISGISDTILKSIEALDPAVAPEAAVVDGVVSLLSDLVGKAITAFSAASDTPITADTIAALIPNSTPLTPPTPS